MSWLQSTPMSDLVVYIEADEREATLGS